MNLPEARIAATIIRIRNLSGTHVDPATNQPSLL
jgi:hypothetical protein